MVSGLHGRSIGGTNACMDLENLPIEERHALQWYAQELLGQFARRNRHIPLALLGLTAERRRVISM